MSERQALQYGQQLKTEDRLFSKDGELIGTVVSVPELRKEAWFMYVRRPSGEVTPLAFPATGTGKLQYER